ncbi:nickel ABC transporter permease subunit NikB [Wolinella succinogenes]|uniref:nickel ABC transporter permease subunit NikB n=1 Tax=Wolinella succinogenes TaxID=844 RepID=UPI00240A2DD2|nr:nickel ABC transporter permease subunit NikB [Wolinella succinogenes]
MRNYIIRRLLLVFPMVLAISFVAFILISFIPSDPAEVALRVNEIVPTPQAIADMRESLGLNDPLWMRYFHWLQNCLHLDFGHSYINIDRTVYDEIARSLPVTLKLAAFAFVIVVAVSFPLGILCAVYRDSLFDKSMRVFIFIFTAIPNYWLALLLMWGLAVYLNLLPTNGASTWKHYILPAVTLSMTYVSTYIRLIRNSMLDNMQENYIFYARVRGIKERWVILRHLLPNSIQSTTTALGMSVVQLIAGTFVIENIFSLPGIGRLCITAIFNRDYPVIQAYILMMGLLFVFCNLLIDIFQALMDPRQRRGVK